MDLTLEQKLVSGVAAFASEKKLYYSLRNSLLEKERDGTKNQVLYIFYKYNLEIGNDETVLEIGLLDYIQSRDSSKKCLVEFATHNVIFNSKGEIVGQGTVSLSDEFKYKTLYIDLINYLQTQSVNLTYDFDMVWKSD